MLFVRGDAVIMVSFASVPTSKRSTLIVWSVVATFIDLTNTIRSYTCLAHFVFAQLAIHKWNATQAIRTPIAMLQNVF